MSTGYAEQVCKYTSSAIEDCETKQAALDLLIDAAAFIVSEGGGTVEDAIERIKESAQTFAEAGEVAVYGGRAC
jgi:hypothetical protein